jgi:mannosyltransferase
MAAAGYPGLVSADDSALIVPVCVLPSQVPRSDDECGERKLLLAVLLDAFDELRRPPRRSDATLTWFSCPDGPEIERTVAAAARQLLNDHAQISASACNLGVGAGEIPAVVKAAGEWSRRVQSEADRSIERMAGRVGAVGGIIDGRSLADQNSHHGPGRSRITEMLLDKPDVVRPRAKSRATAWRLVAVITLLAATLDLFRLGTQPIWLDESLSIAIARLSTDDFVMFIKNHEPFMLLYYVLLRMWLAFDQSEVAVRSLSVIFAVAAVPSLYLLGRRLFDERTAALAALLLAVNSLFIQYAQEARSYTLTTLIVIWSWYALLELLDRPSWRRTFYYSLATAALAYCQILSLLMLPAQWATLTVLPGRRRVLRFVVAGTVIVGILILPMVLMSLPLVQAEVDWITPPDVLLALHQLSVRFINIPHTLGPVPHTMMVLIIIIVAPIALPFLGVASVVQEMDRGKLFGYACAALGATFPLACLLTASLLIQPIYVMRYVLPSLPFFLLILAAGLCELRATVMRAGFVVLLAANVLGTLEYYRVPSKPDWRQAAEYLVSRVRAEDKLAMIPWYQWCPLKYNLSRLGHTDLAPMVVFPARDSISYLPSRSAMSAALAPTYSRLWIISEAPGPRDNDILEDLDKRYPCSCQRNFRGISVTLYALKDCEG